MNWDGGHGPDLSGLEQGQEAETCEYGDEPSISKNAGYFFTSRGPGSFSGRIVITIARNAIYISLNDHKQTATPQRHNCTVK